MSTPRLRPLLLLVLLLGLHWPRAEGMNVTIAFTNSLRGRLFQFDRFGGNCKEELYSCCDLVPGCKGGMSRVASAAKELRASRPEESVVLLDGGQQVGDTSAWQTFRGSMMREMMLQINYTAKGVATHELYLGPNNLAEFVNGQEQFTLLSANLKVDPGHQLAQLLSAQMVVEVGGVVLGITSITPSSICTASSCNINGRQVVSAVPHAAALSEAIGFMLNRGADLLVVVASGFGFIEARALAERTPHVDVVICAPDEWGDALEQFPYVLEGPTGKEVLLLTNKQFGETFAYVDLELDELSRQVLRWNATRVVLDESAPFDEDVSSKLREAEELAAVERPVGNALAAFECPDNEAANQTGSESTVGNLIADAILDSARGLGATIAIANAGGIRNTIPAGVITDKRARGVLPFANSVSVLHITGHTLGQALNNSVSALGAASGSGRFLQIAGARMKFDMGRNQTGRAFDVHTLNTNGTWSPLQSDTVYVVAVPDFIRNGGDDFDMLAEKNLQAWDQGPGLASVLIAYLEARYPTPGVRPLLEGRIVNATAGAPPLVYACASSMVLSALEGNLRDGCAAERVYTRIRWAIEPPEGEEYLAIVLTIRIDPQWLEGHNGTGTLADTEFINIISGQVSPAGDGFTYSSSGLSMLDSELGSGGLETGADGERYRTLVLSALAVAIEVESARSMVGWRPLEVDYEVVDVCPAGYSVEESGLQSAQCNPCPRGTFSVEGGDCTPCLPGTANFLSAQASCVPCAPGEFQPFGGQLQCEACDTAKEEGSAVCPETAAIPVYGIIILVVGLLLLLLLFLWLGYRLLTRPRGVSAALYHIDFNDLQFGKPPVVLGSGQLGVILAAKYRSFPVTVKQISGRSKPQRATEGRASSSLEADTPAIGLGNRNATLGTQWTADLTEVMASAQSMLGRRASTAANMSQWIRPSLLGSSTDDLSIGNGGSAISVGSQSTSTNVGAVAMGDEEAPPPAKPAKWVVSEDVGQPGHVQADVAATEASGGAAGSLMPSMSKRKRASEKRKKANHVVPLTTAAPTDSTIVDGSAANGSRPNTLAAVPSAWWDIGKTSMNLRQSSKKSKVAAGIAGLSSKVLSARVGQVFTLRHPHIVTLMGLTNAPDGSLCLVMEHLERGCLSDVLANPMVPLDASVQFGICRDVAAGMNYMHLAQPPVLHRMLRAANVKLDGKFTAKVSDFGLGALLGTSVTQRGVHPLWMAPEVLRGEPATCASDVYAYGVLLYETWTRKEPYEGEDLEQVVRDVARPPPGALRVIWKRPILPEGHAVPSAIVDLMEVCWHQDPLERPSFDDIIVTLEMVECEVTEAAEAAAERERQKLGQQDRQLLEQILPPHIAGLLKEGKEVPPEQHELVTVLFTDIVGFTDISSTLQPAQVMNMLNRLYNEFDALSAEYDLFKVETIGDAYMAVANLHKKQPDHTLRMARFALDAIAAAQRVEVLPGGGSLAPDGKEWGTLRIRAGIHCGPVVASVVGKLNPRYCLFGDTVNTASRMESNSVALRAHLSMTAASNLVRQAPSAKLEKRGKVEIKGKGSMTTFWLLDCPKPSVRTISEGAVEGIGAHSDDESAEGGGSSRVEKFSVAPGGNSTRQGDGSDRTIIQQLDYSVVLSVESDTRDAVLLGLTPRGQAAAVADAVVEDLEAPIPIISTAEL